MSENDDIRRQLESWGSTDQPSPPGPFANRLDTELRTMASERQIRRGLTFRTPAIVIAAILLVLAGSFAFLRGQAVETVLVMTAASDTEVVLPDGEVVAGTSGTKLPVGTRIHVGAGGSATVDGVVLPRGSEAIVGNGGLEILRDPAPPRAASTLPPTANTTTSAGRSTSSAPPTTSRPTVPPTSRPADAVPTTREVAQTTTSVPTTRPPSTTTTTAPSSEIRLDAASGDALVVLSWSYGGPENVTEWDVISTSGDRSRTVVVLRDPAVRSVTIERAGSTVVYRIVARSANGVVVAESNPATVG